MIGSLSSRKRKQNLKRNYALAVICCLLLLFVDSRHRAIITPLRSTVILLLEPLQYALKQPVNLVSHIYYSVADSHKIQSEKEKALKALSLKAFDASREQWLIAENQRLRELLDLKEQTQVKTIAADVIDYGANPLQQTVTINRGLFHDASDGDVIIDEKGVIGQIIQSHFFTSQVRLITDPEHNLPVQILRTGQQGILFGAATNNQKNLLQLHFIAPESDVKLNDLLITSGIDNIYVGGMPVAVITSVKNRPNNQFLTITATPVGLITNLRHVLIVKKTNAQQPQL